MSFKGFKASDFGPTISGSRWQSPLGKEIAEAITRELKTQFDYSRPGRYNTIYLRHGWYIPFQHAAFEITPKLDLFTGIKIERGYEHHEQPIQVYNSSWDFWRFQKGLVDHDPKIFDALNLAFEKGNSLLIITEKDTLMLKVISIEQIEEAINLLINWDAQQWCNVYIGKSIPAKEAIQLGGQAANYCIDIILELSGLYWLIV